MADAFHNVDDVIAKLNGTICKWKGQHIYVQIQDVVALRDRNSVNIYKLDDTVNSIGLVDYTKDDFDYNDIELGWFYSPEREFVTHLCRRPGRYNNVGLKYEQLDTSIGRNNFFSKQMIDCLTGNHMSYKEALEKVWTSNVFTIPFHRHAAIIRLDSYNGCIKWMTKNIAHIDRSGMIIPFNNSSGSSSKILLKRIGVI